MESTFCPIRSTYFPLDILGVLLAFQNVSQTKPGKRYLIFFSLLAYSYCAGGGSCLGDMEVCQGGDNFMLEMEQTDIHKGSQLFVLSSFLEAFFQCVSPCMIFISSFGQNTDGVSYILIISASSIIHNIINQGMDSSWLQLPFKN